MSQTLPAAQAVNQPNPQYLSALSMVDSVRRQIQALFPQLFIPPTVTVTQAQVQGWIQTLEAAVQLIQSVPVILIFPPPLFAQFANAALEQINQALQTLQSIQFITPTIFPPPPAQATVPSQTLLGVLNNLRQAEIFLLLAAVLA